MYYEAIGQSLSWKVKILGDNFPHKLNDHRTSEWCRRLRASVSVGYSYVADGISKQLDIGD